MYEFSLFPNSNKQDGYKFKENCHHDFEPI